MKDRLNPCIYYICKGETCQKGIKEVDMLKCSHCAKYRPRKSNTHTESIRSKRQKSKDKSDRKIGWK